jgi:hypothetical protein
LFSWTRYVAKNYSDIFSRNLTVSVEVENLENQVHLSVNVWTVNLEHQLYKVFRLNTLFLVPLRSKCEKTITDNTWTVYELNESVFVEECRSRGCRHRLNCR